MEHEISIRHLGPIEECRMTIKQFNVLTGPQSNGKSTIAKVVYYFRSIKQDILNVMYQGGPAKVTGVANARWQNTMKQRMKEKFLQIFGTSWIMPSDMELIYTYAGRDGTIRVFLKEDWNTPGHNYINVDFGQKLVDYFEDIDGTSFLTMTPGQRDHEEKRLAKLLDDPYETVFIPAGRNLITLLSEQLNYIFTSLEDSQLRNIDYVTKRYVELILKIKPSFYHGMREQYDEARNDMAGSGRTIVNQPAINLLIENARKVIQGTYRYVEGEERLYIDDKKFVKINFASSGQQEIVWVFNLLFYYLLEDKRVLLILEEPESHLYPESQRVVGEVLGLFLNEGKNAELITTHSPYLLGTFNYMLQAGQCPSPASDAVKKKLRKRYWLTKSQVGAHYVRNGAIESAFNTTQELTLIKNELIDDAADQINEMSDFILEQEYMAEGAND